MGLIGDIAPELLNRIRMRRRRRITVTLGNPNLLCAAVGTVLGKKQRLQIVGHYYEVITGAAAGDAVTEAYTNCLAYWRAKRETALGAPFADDAAMEADLELQVRRFVVEDNALPAVGHKKKIRFPGTLTFNTDNDLGQSTDPDGVALPSVRYNDEKTLWDSNAAIGRIPLVITVEMQVAGAWVPAPNDWVHVQLVAPFYEDAAHELDDVNAQRATSMHYPGGGAAGTAVAAGPKPFVTAAMATSYDAADPQQHNCHKTRGGKRGEALLGADLHKNLFDSLPAAFPNMNAAAASAHTNAVKVQANALGQCGVLWMPARMGGDRYRLRFFLDPLAGHASDGTETDAVKFETGRFVVYKHMLLSNYYQKPAPTFPALNSVEGVQARLATLLYDTGIIDNKDGTNTQGAVRHFQRNHGLPQNGHWSHAGTQARLDQEVTDFLSGGGAFYVTSFGPGFAAVDFGFMQTQLELAYCELEVEPDILNGTRTTLTAAIWHDAFLWARGQAQANRATYGLSAVRDVNAMFVDNFETPYLFEVAHPNEYNRRRTGVPASPATPPAAPHGFYWLDAQRIIYGTNGLLDLMLRYINGRASAASPPTANLTKLSTPGITVIATMAGSSRVFWRTSENNTPWVRNNLAAYGTSLASGFARAERGAAVFGGSGYYATFNAYHLDAYSCNTMHEMGHVLYLRHQFTGNQVNNVVNYMHAGWSFREDHDSVTASAPPAIPAPTAYDRCVMGYLECDGEFCGKCQLKLRGWDIQTMPV